MAINTVGVVGAGQMGNGIAHVFALAGYEVLLNDIDEDRIRAAIELIRENMNRQVARNIIDEADMKAGMARIQPAAKLEAIARTDLVIEAATEKEEVKRQIFATLLPDLKPETILTTNTSSISITRLASRTDRPERFFVSEIIREKILENYHQEIPYSVEVGVESFKETKTKKGDDLIRIRAEIYVMRPTQKSIIIGKGGSSIKQLGTDARKALETFLETKVFLDLHVKVRDNWRDDDQWLKRFGY